MQSTSSVLHPTSWKKETGNWLKTEQDKANQILTTKETLYLITDYDSSVLHPTSWKKETGNWLKTEQDKANHQRQTLYLITDYEAKCTKKKKKKRN